MWWSDRRAILIALGAGALSACGFAPVYGPQGGGSALQGAVALADPVTRAEYLLVQRLEDRLGRATTPRYRLEVVLSTRTQGLGTSAEGDTTRFHLVGTARYTLKSATQDTVLVQGDTDAFTGYSATGSTVATLAAERDALARLMVILGDQITDRLLLAAASLPAP